MKTSLVYGTLLAVIGALMTFGMYFAGFHDTPEKMKAVQWPGLAVILIAVIVCLALAMKTRRAEFPADREWGYGSALGTGVLTGLWSALIGAVLGYVYMAIVNPQFGETVYQLQIMLAEQKGAPAAQIEGMSAAKGFITSPVFMTIGQAIQAFLGCLVFSLIIAIFFRKREEPALTEAVPPTV